MNGIIVGCPHCRAKNRVPRAKIHHTAKCGKCGAAFVAADHILASPVMVTDATFSQEVLQSPLPVLVDVWASWCGPCRMIAPIIEEVAQEFAGQLKVAKLNSDQNQKTAAQYHIQGIPTLLFFKNGKMIEQLVGAVPKPHIVSKIQQLF